MLWEISLVKRSVVEALAVTRLGWNAGMLSHELRFRLSFCGLLLHELVEHFVT